MFRTMIATGVAVTALVVPAAAAQASSSHGLHFRKGLTLTVPSSWKVAGKGDWKRVVTGKHSFQVLGPEAIKMGHEIFRPYTPDAPFYPATDVQPCPYDKKLYIGTAGTPVKGLKQVGPGHKAYYRAWPIACTNHSGKVVGHFTQREWYLPASKILIVDRFGTKNLAAILKNASWS
ncbi:hypothetical protein J5X84_22955 [Streptosporangiaceae bacterium NEAU-GS5]|nr:hypothetical protein [Streptosporangiaceae bacterium NEAU-GS5]